MIYFDLETRKKLINNYYKFTKDKGYLFVGHTESLNQTWCPYKYIEPGVYQKI